MALIRAICGTKENYPRNGSGSVSGPRCALQTTGLPAAGPGALHQGKPIGPPRPGLTPQVPWVNRGTKREARFSKGARLSLGRISDNLAPMAGLPGKHVTPAHYISSRSTLAVPRGHDRTEISLRPAGLELPSQVHGVADRAGKTGHMADIVQSSAQLARSSFVTAPVAWPENLITALEERQAEFGGRPKQRPGPTRRRLVVALDATRGRRPASTACRPRFIARSGSHHARRGVRPAEPGAAGRFFAHLLWPTCP